MKSFARWAIQDGRIPASPLECLKPLDAKKVKNDCRRERRPFTVEEIRQLLEMTQQLPDRAGRTWRMTGPERALAYRLAVETGLRQNELRTLTKSSFQLSTQEPAVALFGQNTKNDDGALVPLRLETAADLRDFWANKLPNAPAFCMPNKDRMMQVPEFLAGRFRIFWPVHETLR